MHKACDEYKGCQWVIPASCHKASYHVHCLFDTDCCPGAYSPVLRIVIYRAGIAVPGIRKIALLILPLRHVYLFGDSMQIIWMTALPVGWHRASTVRVIRVPPGIEDTAKRRKGG